VLNLIKVGHRFRLCNLAWTGRIRILERRLRWKRVRHLLWVTENLTIYLY